MDIQEIQNKKVLGMLGLSAKAGKIISGADATIQDIERHKIFLVIVAKDASEKTKKNIKFICDKNKVKMLQIGTIEQISKAIGKSNKAIVGIKSKSMASGIEKILNKGVGGDLLNG